MPNGGGAMNAYQKRDAILREIGFSSYADYLRSPLWASIRKDVLERDHHLCRGCGHRAWQVHHREYSSGALDGSDISELEAICGPCHRKIEFRYKRKNGLGRANAKLKKMDRRRAKHALYASSPEYRRLAAEKKRLMALDNRLVKAEIGEVSRRMREMQRLA